MRSSPPRTSSNRLGSRRRPSRGRISRPSTPWRPPCFTWDRRVLDTAAWSQHSSSSSCEREHVTSEQAGCCAICSSVAARPITPPIQSPRRRETDPSLMPRPSLRSSRHGSSARPDPAAFLHLTARKAHRHPPHWLSARGHPLRVGTRSCTSAHLLRLAPGRSPAARRWRWFRWARRRRRRGAILAGASSLRRARTVSAGSPSPP
jgi:hypothetical protein